MAKPDPYAAHDARIAAEKAANGGKTPSPYAAHDARVAAKGLHTGAGTLQHGYMVHDPKPPEHAVSSKLKSAHKATGHGATTGTEARVPSGSSCGGRWTK